MNIEQYMAECGPIALMDDFTNKPNWMIDEKSFIGKQVVYSNDTESSLFIGFYEDKFDFYYGLKDNNGKIHYSSCAGGIKLVKL